MEYQTNECCLSVEQNNDIQQNPIYPTNTGRLLRGCRGPHSSTEGTCMISVSVVATNPLQTLLKWKNDPTFGE